MRAGQVETLLILDGNPVYAMPGFREALQQVPFSLCTAPAPNETARITTWYVPGTHLFEAWGDARAHDGTVSIQQPQALPLYGGHDAFEVLALFEDGAPVRGLERVRQTWREQLDDAAWQDALADGVVPGTAYTPVTAGAVDRRYRLVHPAPSRRNLNLLIRPDPNLIDGRYANNPWLQELPRPLGKIAWDNPLLLAPATARASDLRNGDVVELAMGARRLRIPIWIVPGLAPDCAVAWLGGGRTAAGEVGNGVGVDVTPLLGIDATPGAAQDRATRSRRQHRPPQHAGGRADARRRASCATARSPPSPPTQISCAEPATSPTIYRTRPPADGGVAWGMSVDLNACIGCNACVVACQAENNVPVVGKEQMLLGREMHWLRIDRYYEGPEDDPDSLLQPMLCMHCEQAPCEPVCPVEASIHDSEGLNLQVYNRCIGTRFCSNNCPYKVRRFNFGAWAAEEHRAPISRNPDVTVRARGVMEKCTFCVQRIAAARIAHDRDGAPEQVVTACQAACPTQAFTFGDINDKTSEVSKRKQSPLDYALLAEQNTRPRLTYEARIVNRNPTIHHDGSDRDAT